ncbi:MAG: CRISPR-associated endonuclease Cas3'' [Planctomycetes bacterium]|nr:CRISPR-associated endonuclease Cas3'' [Planctomycetota bacterium]
MTSEVDFAAWFKSVTGHDAPRAWQEHLAGEPNCRDRMIRIPTGLGKTEGVLSTWSFHRLGRCDDSWPRRLVWCLPMRVLVEQTEEVARKLAEAIPAEKRPKVHVVMGGEDGGEWFLSPEHAAIIIGTQDMLLSRALNRGYASPRARWPMEFGLLNHDALWVMDEVQLMDVGLATSAQLQAFREEDREKGFRPCHSWWMSATLQPEWLRSVDTEPYHERWMLNPCVIAAEQRRGGLWDIRKSLVTETIGPKDDRALAQRILSEHSNAPAGEFGRITLVVCNTVHRACGTFDALRVAGRTEGLELVHSRFRPAEREDWRARFLSRPACTADADRIIVATQVVEAGVDLSAGCLITELAPWPSLVQRFGRCARYGGSGKVLVVDRGRDEAICAPYTPEQLESAWGALQQLRERGVGLDALESHEESLSPEVRTTLYPFAPSQLLLRREFDELFDTTPDLTGADLDISRFIRSGDERDLQVFWLDLAKDESPPSKRHPLRQELCSVPFLKARDWLCGEETKTTRKPKLRSAIRAWIWDWLDGEWVPAERQSLLPGRVVCVAAACGGYTKDRGFNPESRVAVPSISLPAITRNASALGEADDQQDGEQLSFNPWKTISFHGEEVASEAREIANEIGLPKILQGLLEQAAYWHDWGKSHPAFQGAMRGRDRPSRSDLAKAPEAAWLKPPEMYKYLDNSEIRPAFRHELASALGLFAILQIYAPQHQALLGPWAELFALLRKPRQSAEQPPAPPPLVQRLLDCSAPHFDVLAYLVASHHGKVRVALHAAPKDQDYRDLDGRGLPIRGIREGDRLPSVALIAGEPPIPEVTLPLSPASIGLSERTGISWRERSLGAVETYGPAGLAFLEAILRAADVRASRLKTNDPMLALEEKV